MSVQFPLLFCQTGHIFSQRFNQFFKLCFPCLKVTALWVQIFLKVTNKTDSLSNTWVTSTDKHRRSHTSYTNPCNGHRQPWGLNWGSSGFYQPNTQKQMRPWSLHAMRCLMRVYLPAQTAVDADDIRTWWTTVILITGKTRRLQFEPHAGIKMAQVIYICGHINGIVSTRARGGQPWQEKNGKK